MNANKISTPYHQSSVIGIESQIHKEVYNERLFPMRTNTTGDGRRKKGPVLPIWSKWNTNLMSQATNSLKTIVFQAFFYQNFVISKGHNYVMRRFFGLAFEMFFGSLLNWNISITIITSSEYIQL